MAPYTGGMAVRVASSDADLDAVTETISLAFHEDPTWSWAFPDESRRQAQYAVFWRLLVAGAATCPLDGHVALAGGTVVRITQWFLPLGRS
jgi:hypothetical protein